MDGSIYWDSQLVARYATLVLIAKEVANYAHRDVNDYRDVMDLLTGKLGSLKLKYDDVCDDDNPHVENTEEQATWENIHDPPMVRTKGCGTSGSKCSQTHRKAQTCGKCGARGHNRRSCSTSTQSAQPMGMTYGAFVTVNVNDEAKREDDFNAQLVSLSPYCKTKV